MPARRVTLLGAFLVVTGCSLLYSSYDSRFSDGGAREASAPLVTDDSGVKIEGLVAASTGLFYYYSDPVSGMDAPVIKCVSFDGGGLSPCWTGDAGVSAIASDSVSNVAWVSGGQPWSARASAPASATSVPSQVTGGITAAANVALAADSTHYGWIGGTSGNTNCPDGGCVWPVVFLAAWGSSTVVPLKVVLDAGNISPHTLSVDEQGTTVQLEAVASDHYAARFDTTGNLKCVASLNVMPQIATPTPGLLYGVDSTGSLSMYPTDSNGCPNMSAAVSLSSQASVFAFDDAGVYWISKTDDAVYTAPFGADAGTLVGPASGATRAIAVYGGSIYIGSGGSIFRLSKSN
jgi:hypothetical protein